MTYADDRVYKNEDKIEIVPISDNKQEVNVSNSTLDTSTKHSKFNKKVYFKSQSNSKSSSTSKFKALAAIVLGALAVSFSNIGNNPTLKPIGILDEISGPMQDKYVLEHKPDVIYGLGKDNIFKSILLKNANLTIKKEL